MKILFYDGTDGFTPTRKDTKACGGILNSLTIIPKYLASKGVDVTVKSTFAEKCDIDGVKYIPNSDKTSIPKWDITIINRNGLSNQLVNYSHSIGAKVVWWLHDIVDMRYLNDASYRRVDKIIALSQYCLYSYSRFYDLPVDKFVIIPNGVDKSIFYIGPYENRKKYRMIYASAPIKGYLPIRDTWLNVRRQFKDAELLIYSNQSLHDKQNTQEHNMFLKEMEEEGAKVMSPIPQHVLAEKMRESWCLLMPNSYPEICSNLLLQAQACGLPVVASNTGSNAEFMDNSLLSEAYPHDMWLWMKLYIEKVVKLFNDDVWHRSISQTSPTNVESWETIGERWLNELGKVVAEPVNTI